MGKRGPAKQFTDEELRERRRARDRARHAANTDRMRAKNRAYHHANREQELARNRAFREENAAAIAATKKRLRSENAERLKLERRLHREATHAARLAYERARRESGADKENQKAWRERNAERERQRLAAWTKANAPKVRAKVARRRAQKLRATPAWADHDAIARIYDECVRVSRETGIPHEVDHFYPLISPIMCGLHVETNLRIVPRRVNRAKNNRVVEESLDEATFRIPDRPPREGAVAGL